MGISEYDNEHIAFLSLYTQSKPICNDSQCKTITRIHQFTPRMYALVYTVFLSLAYLIGIILLF